LRYEIASALAQAVSAGQLASNAVAGASQRIGSVPIILHQLNDTPAVVAVAQRPVAARAAAVRRLVARQQRRP